MAKTTKYAALLRGVNVGGRVIKMAELKACFEDMGLNNVKTILQSGNVVFESEKSATELKKQIEETLTKKFNYPAKAWVISDTDIAEIIKNNPFKDVPAHMHQYVLFFEDGLEKDFADEAKSLGGDLGVGPGIIYWTVEKGQTLQNPRGKLITKAKYKNFNTNRNINTLEKLTST